MTTEEELKKYDHAASLSRQIERVNTKIVKGLNQEDKSAYLDSVIMGLMTIENFYIAPFVENDYKKFSDWTILGKSNSKKLEFIGKAQRQLARKMKEADLFFTMFENETLGEMDKIGGNKEP